MSEWMAGADLDITQFNLKMDSMIKRGKQVAEDLEKAWKNIPIDFDLTGLDDIVKKINKLNGLGDLSKTLQGIDTSLVRLNTTLDAQLNKENKINSVLKERNKILRENSTYVNRGGTHQSRGSSRPQQSRSTVDLQATMMATSTIAKNYRVVEGNKGLPQSKVNNAFSNFIKNWADLQKQMADIEHLGLDVNDILKGAGVSVNNYGAIADALQSVEKYRDLMTDISKDVEKGEMEKLMAWVRDIYSAKQNIKSVIDLAFQERNPPESKAYVKELRADNVAISVETALKKYEAMINEMESLGLASDDFRVKKGELDNFLSELENKSAGNKGTLSGFKQKLDKLMQGMTFEMKQFKSSQTEDQVIQDMQSQQQKIQLVKSQYDRLLQTVSSFYKTQGVEDIQAKLKEQNAFFETTDDELKAITSTSNLEDAMKVNDTLVGLRAVFATLSELNTQIKQGENLRLDGVKSKQKIQQIQELFGQYTLGKAGLGSRGTGSKYQISSDVIGFDLTEAELAKKSLKELEIVLAELRRVNKIVQADLKETTNTGLGQFGERVKKIISWTVSVQAIQLGQKALRSGWQEIVNTETALVSLNKVMNLSRQELDKMSDSAFRLGKQYGFLGTEVLQATEIFAKQFKDVGDVSRLTEVALLASNVGEMTTDQAGKYITAAMNQYNIGIDSAVTILDKWNEVSNRNAVTTVDLAEAMSQTGAAAKLAGIDMDRLNGMVAALAQATAKSGSEIGSTLKFMFSRARTDATIAGFQSVGISAMETADTYRKLSDIFDELSFKWDTLSEKEKTTVAKAMGGRRYADFIVLMDNYDKALKAQTDSLASLGSAEREDQKVMQSTMKIMKQLGAATGKLAVEIGNSGILETIKVSMQGLTNVISVVSLLPAPLLNATMALTIFSIASKKGLIALTALSGGMNVLLALIAGAGVWTIGKLISTQEHEIDVANERIKVLDQELERKRNMIELNKQLSIPEKEQVIDELNIANIKAKTEELEKLIKRRDYLFEQAKSLPESSKTRVLLEKDVLDLTNVISNLEIQIQSAMPKLQATLAEYMSMDLWGKLEIWQEDIEEKNKKLKDDLNRLNLAFKAGGLSIGEYYGLLAQLENKDHFAKLRESVLELNDTLKNDTAKAFESAFGDLFSGKKDWFKSFSDALKNMNVKLSAKMAADYVMSGSYMKEAMLGQQVGLGTLASSIFGLKQDLEHLKWNEKYETKIASAETAMANWGERKESKSLEKIIEDFNDNVEVLQYFNADMKIDQNQLQGLLDSLKKTNKEAWDALIAEWSKKDTIVVGGAEVQVNSEGKIISFNGQVVMKVDGELLKDMLISNEVSPNRVSGLTEAQAIEYIDYMVLGKDQIGDLWTFLDEQGHLSNKTYNALSNLMSYVGTEQRLFDFIANPNRSMKDLFGEEQWKVIEQEKETDLAWELVVRAVRAYEQQLPEELKRLLGKDFFSGFSSGGYTGSGGKFDPAGIVHKGEYVVPDWILERYPELVAQMEKIRTGKGFAQGGFTDHVPLADGLYQRQILLNPEKLNKLSEDLYKEFKDAHYTLKINLAYNKKTGEDILTFSNKTWADIKKIKDSTQDMSKSQKNFESLQTELVNVWTKENIKSASRSDFALSAQSLVKGVSKGVSDGIQSVAKAGKDYTYGFLEKSLSDGVSSLRSGDTFLGNVAGGTIDAVGKFGLKELQDSKLLQWFGLIGGVGAAFDMDFQRALKISLEDLIPNLLRSMFGLKRYDSGGYTGSGGKFQPAGVVHKGEYVMPKWMVEKYPEIVGGLEGVRTRGFAEGGGKGLYFLTLPKSEPLEDIKDLIGKGVTYQEKQLKIEEGKADQFNFSDQFWKQYGKNGNILQKSIALNSLNPSLVGNKTTGTESYYVSEYGKYLEIIEGSFAEATGALKNFADNPDIAFNMIKKRYPMVASFGMAEQLEVLKLFADVASQFDAKSVEELLEVFGQKFMDTWDLSGIEAENLYSIIGQIGTEIKLVNTEWYQLIDILKQAPEKLGDVTAGFMNMYAVSGESVIAGIGGALAGGIKGIEGFEEKSADWFNKLLGIDPTKEGSKITSGAGAVQGAGLLLSSLGGAALSKFGLGEQTNPWASMLGGAGGLVGSQFGFVGSQAAMQIGTMVGGIIDNWIGGAKDEIDKEIRESPWQKQISTPDYYAMEDRFYLSGRYAALLDGRALERLSSSLDLNTNAVNKNTEVTEDIEFNHVVVNDYGDGRRKTEVATMSISDAGNRLGWA